MGPSSEAHQNPYEKKGRPRPALFLYAWQIQAEPATNTTATPPWVYSHTT